MQFRDPKNCHQAENKRLKFTSAHRTAHSNAIFMPTAGRSTGTWSTLHVGMFCTSQFEFSLKKRKSGQLLTVNLKMTDEQQFFKFL